MPFKNEKYRPNYDYKLHRSKSFFEALTVKQLIKSYFWNEIRSMETYGESDFFKALKLFMKEKNKWDLINEFLVQIFEQEIFDKPLDRVRFKLTDISIYTILRYGLYKTFEEKHWKYVLENTDLLKIILKNYNSPDTAIYRILYEYVPSIFVHNTINIFKNSELSISQLLLQHAMYFLKSEDYELIFREVKGKIFEILREIAGNEKWDYDKYIFNKIYEIPLERLTKIMEEIFIEGREKALDFLFRYNEFIEGVPIEVLKSLILNPNIFFNERFFKSYEGTEYCPSGTNSTNLYKIMSKINPFSYEQNAKAYVFNEKNMQNIAFHTNHCLSYLNNDTLARLIEDPRLRFIESIFNTQKSVYKRDPCFLSEVFWKLEDRCKHSMKQKYIDIILKGEIEDFINLIRFLLYREEGIFPDSNDLIVQALEEANLTQERFNQIINIDYDERKLPILNYESRISLEKLPILNGYLPFCMIIYMIKSSDTFTNYISFIKTRFLLFLKEFNKISDDQKYKAFRDLLWTAKETGLIKEHFLDFLKAFPNLLDRDKQDVFSDLFKLGKEMGLIKNFSTLLDGISKFPDYYKFHALVSLITAIRGTELFNNYYFRIKTQLLALVDVIAKFVDEEKFDGFTTLFELSKEFGLIKECFSVFLDVIDKIPDQKKYNAFSELINLSKKTELLNENFARIEKIFLSLIESIDKFTDEEKLNIFYSLLEGTKETGLIKLNFIAIVNIIDKFTNHTKLKAFFTLLELFKKSSLIIECFPFFLKAIEILSDQDKIYAFSALIDSIKNTDLLINHYAPIKSQFLLLLNAIEKRPEYAFIYSSLKLFNAINGTILLKENLSQIESIFLLLIDFINKLPNKDKSRPLISFINTFKGTKLMKKHYSAISNIRIQLFLFLREMYPDLIKIFDELTTGNQKITRMDIYTLPNATKETNEVFNNYYEVLKTIHNELGPIKIDLHEHKIEDIDYLSTIDCVPSEILEIDFSNNLIEKIKGLEKFKNLRFLNLNNNKIKKIENLEDLDELSILSLSGNDINTIDCFPHKIVEIDLSNNQIEKITGLNKCKNLRLLNLNNNKIKNVNDIKLPECEYLKNEEIDLSNNLINELDGIQRFSNVRRLKMNNNKISNIDALNNLEQLEHLSLRNNIISNMESIISLPNLESLDLSGNRELKEIPEWLNSLPALNSVNFMNCNLKKFSESTSRFFWMNQNYRFYSNYTPEDVEYYESHYNKRKSKSNNQCYKHFVVWLLKMQDLKKLHKFTYEDMYKYEELTKRMSFWSGGVTDNFLKWLDDKKQTRITSYKLEQRK